MSKIGKGEEGWEGGRLQEEEGRGEEEKEVEKLRVGEAEEEEELSQGRPVRLLGDGDGWTVAIRPQRYNHNYWRKVQSFCFNWILINCQLIMVA